METAQSYSTCSCTHLSKFHSKISCTLPTMHNTSTITVQQACCIVSCKDNMLIIRLLQNIAWSVQYPFLNPLAPKLKKRQQERCKSECMRWKQLWFGSILENTKLTTSEINSNRLECGYSILYVEDREPKLRNGMFLVCQRF